MPLRRHQPAESFRHPHPGFGPQLLRDPPQERLYVWQVPSLALVHVNGRHLRLPDTANFDKCVRPLAHNEVQRVRFVGLQAIRQMHRVKERSRRADESGLEGNHPYRQVVGVDGA